MYFNKQWRAEDELRHTVSIVGATFFLFLCGYVLLQNSLVGNTVPSYSYNLFNSYLFDGHFCNI